MSIIRTETQEATGLPPEYEVVDGSSLILRIPAAKLELVPADATVTVHSQGEPLADIEVLALFPNKTWARATTDEAGDAALDLYTTNLPMTIYVAAPGYAAGLERAWTPNRGGLLLELEPLESGGATIFAQSTGHLPGLRGRLNPIRDTSDRTYLYADNISIDEGRQQPVPFRPGKPMRLTDAHGSELSVTIVDILGRSALIEYRPFEQCRVASMSGQVELERCHAELVKYIRNCSDEYPIGQQDIAATQAFLPHVVKLSRILDEQDIPHPPISQGVTFTGTGEWGRFLANLMAVQHDIEQARRVYQDSGSS